MSGFAVEIAKNRRVTNIKRNTIIPAYVIDEKNVKSAIMKSDDVLMANRASNSLEKSMTQIRRIFQYFPVTDYCFDDALNLNVKIKEEFQMVETSLQDFAEFNDIKKKTADDFATKKA